MISKFLFVLGWLALAVTFLMPILAIVTLPFALLCFLPAAFRFVFRRTPA